MFVLNQLRCFKDVSRNFHFCLKLINLVNNAGNPLQRHFVLVARLSFQAITVLRQQFQLRSKPLSRSRSWHFLLEFQVSRFQLLELLEYVFDSGL